MKNSKKIIVVENVVKQFYDYNTKKERIALNKVNFSINQGDLVVILGPSGSGKSTLLNILSGLDKVDQGKVFVNDVELTKLSEKKMTSFRRENIGFVFQSHNLLPDLNAHDNVLMGQILQKDKSKRMDIVELFKSLEIQDFLYNDIQNLSGGQQQRVSIARALSKNPNIIFADEPTGALDKETTSKVIELFKLINEKYKTTIIVVTHDDKWKNIADVVLKVKNGVVSTNG